MTGVKGSGPHGRRTQREGPAESPQEGGAPLPDILRSLGYPHSRKNGGHSRSGSPDYARAFAGRNVKRSTTVVSSPPRKKTPATMVTPIQSRMYPWATMYPMPSTRSM